jgi:hypothetical protein
MQCDFIGASHPAAGQYENRVYPPWSAQKFEIKLTQI